MDMSGHDRARVADIFPLVDAGRKRLSDDNDVVVIQRPCRVGKNIVSTAEECTQLLGGRLLFLAAK